MSENNGLLKIGDFAEAANTNLRTLRYYEELGLLTPASRSAGGFRYYRPTDVHRVLLIRSLQELGLHLDRIRDLMGSREALEGRRELLERTRRALGEHLELLEKRRRVLDEQSGSVRSALDKLDACDGCEHSPGPENNYCEPCTRTGTALPDLLSALF
ncbi:MAG: MerR family transcriptional regulator [Planctomycetota bacterium]|jgi:DNA-binding transcriptional MerR regulator|nr:MerR family transcriptional regulator [Planctomycetota bacterium]MDP6762104.1 MerR family transcriptional regulator [Planctomycetota bacterium]MDP6989093.1 MerR family transcriptional regulator [Planctomycetota bacterium]